MGLSLKTLKILADADEGMRLLAEGMLFYQHDPRGGGLRLWRRRKPPRKKVRPLCGARTRKGTPCQARALPGKKRCKYHGGGSTGPRTPEGKARIAESNRRRAARSAE